MTVATGSQAETIVKAAIDNIDDQLYSIAGAGVGVAAVLFGIYKGVGVMRKLVK